MKQTLQIPKTGTVRAIPAGEPVLAISDADLNKVTGGGGALGGVIQRSRN